MARTATPNGKSPARKTSRAIQPAKPAASRRPAKAPAADDHGRKTPAKVEPANNGHDPAEHADAQHVNGHAAPRRFTARDLLGDPVRIDATVQFMDDEVDEQQDGQPAGNPFAGPLCVAAELARIAQRLPWRAGDGDAYSQRVKAQMAADDLFHRLQRLRDAYERDALNQTPQQWTGEKPQAIIVQHDGA